MDASTRKALQTLQSLLDEGFVDEAEYAVRRKKIIDAATQVPSNATAKSSVFARLGMQSSTGQTGDKWSHDGYESLYGAAKPSSKARLAGITKAKHTKQVVVGDLRSKLAGKGRKVGGQSRNEQSKPKGPARCPW